MSTRVRPAAVAGAFYPEKPSALEECVRKLLESAGRSPSPAPKAIIVPHAGYIYSGPIAASIYAPLRRQRDTIRRVVLLGPAHRLAFDGLAAPQCLAFDTPLGEVPIDQAAIATLADLPQVKFNDAAHADEHSLEVQLPFLIEIFERFSLVPLTVGRATVAEVSEVLERLWGGDDTLIVISSDLSHYLPYDDAWALDGQTAQSILAMETTIKHQQACGATPVNGLLAVAHRHHLHAHMVDLRNSGDTAGDKSRVVGYGAFAFFETPPEPMNDAHE